LSWHPSNGYGNSEADDSDDDNDGDGRQCPEGMGRYDAWVRIRQTRGRSKSFGLKESSKDRSQRTDMVAALPAGLPMYIQLRSVDLCTWGCEYLLREQSLCVVVQ